MPKAHGHEVNPSCTPLILWKYAYACVDIVLVNSTCDDALFTICDSMQDYFPSLCPFVPYNCIGIIYVFGVESSQESIGEVSFAFGILSANDIFQF